MDVEQIAPADLTPYPKNSRTHTAKQVTAIGRALQQWGFLQPVVADEEGTILIGHGRVEAALSIGLATVPVVRRAGLSPEQKAALVISDNRLAEMSKWDDDVLSDELHWLLGEKFDVTLTTRDIPESKHQREVEGKDKPDPVSVAGDAWILGQSVLICGDGGQPGPLSTALAFGTPDLLITEAPSESDGEGLSRALASAGAPIAYVWHGGPQAGRCGALMEVSGYDLRAQIVLAYSDVKGKGRGKYGHALDLCWYGVLGGSTANWKGGRSQTTVWREGEHDVVSREVQFGRALRRPITAHTDTGALIFDPFAGRGDVLIAAAATGRRCVAIEASPTRVDGTIARWENYARKDAIHGSGKTFAEIRESREAPAAGG